MKLLVAWKILICWQGELGDTDIEQFWAKNKHVVTWAAAHPQSFCL